VLELHITAAGREALEAARQQVEPVERRVLDAFSAKERKLLAELLTRWIEAAEGE